MGQTIPFQGDYGISTNPESFASYAYRIYFADKNRGAILRLSRDGLTAISEHGMRTWFRDNFGKVYVNQAIGNFDKDKNHSDILID